MDRGNTNPARLYSDHLALPPPPPAAYSQDWEVQDWEARVHRADWGSWSNSQPHVPPPPHPYHQNSAYSRPFHRTWDQLERSYHQHFFYPLPDVLLSASSEAEDSLAQDDEDEDEGLSSQTSDSDSRSNAESNATSSASTARTDATLDFNTILEESREAQAVATPVPIDLTRTSSPSTSTMPSTDSRNERQRKRPAASTTSSAAAHGPSAKRRRPNDAHHSHPSASTSQNTNTTTTANTSFASDPTIEILDLCASDDEANSLATTAKKLLSKQRADQISSQAVATSAKKKPKAVSKLTTLTCSICIEPPTDLVGTACGHTFCRACLLDWLISSEREAGKKATCPACRKALNRNETRTRKDVVPLVFMRGKPALA